MSEKDFGVTLDNFHQALSSRIRRRILTLLSQQGTLSAGQIVDQFDVAQPTISNHLRILTESSLVSRRPEGSRVFFDLRADTLTTRVTDLFRDLAVSPELLEERRSA